MKVSVYYFLCIFSVFPLTAQAPIDSWDGLDRALRGISDVEKQIELYNQVNPALSDPDEEDSYGYENVIRFITNAYDRQGMSTQKNALFVEAITRMEAILNQIEKNGDLDDYKEYCWSIGNMCQIAGFKEKQDYYYDLRENAQPKTVSHEWDAVSDEIGGLYMGGDHAGAKTLYEATLARIGEPKSESDSYTALLAYMAGVYAALGEQEKSTAMSQMMMNQALAGLDAEQSALYSQSLGQSNQMIKEMEQKQQNRDATGDANQIGMRLGVQQEILPDFDEYNQMPSQTREMWKQMLYMNEDYQNAPASQRNEVINRLAREQLGAMITEIDPSVTIPAQATFDDVFDLLDRVMKTHFQAYEKAFDNSGLENSVNEFRDDLNENVSGIIELYSYLIQENENKMLFSKQDYEVLIPLSGVHTDKASDKLAVAEIIINAISESRSSLGIPLAKSEEIKLKSVIQNQLDNYGTFLGKEVDLSAFASVDESEEKNYFEVFSEWISDSELNIKNETTYYKILKDELVSANAAGQLLAVNDIQGLSLGSQKLDNWAKYQEVFDRAALRIIKQDHFDIFEDYAPLDYNDMIASRALDYKTQRFLMEGVSASSNADLASMYLEMRQKKEAIGQINMMPDSTQVRLGWDRVTKARTINEIKEAERILYGHILKVNDFATFAKSYFIKWQEIQTSLKPNEAFVDVRRVQELKSGDKRAGVFYIYIIVTSQGRPKKIVSKNILIEESLYIKSGSTELSKTEKDGRRPQDVYLDHSVYDIFWAPIDKELGYTINTVYLNPDGLYHNLSFESMIKQSDEYLFEKRRVVRLAEIADIREHSARSNEPTYFDRNLYFFGFPTYDEIPLGAERVDDSFSKNLSKIYKKMFDNIGNIDPLHGSLDEVTIIDTIARTNGYKSTLFTHLDANESQLKSLDEPDIIHLATHGKFIEEQDKSSTKVSYYQKKLTENPMLRSHVYLAGAEKARKGKIVNADNGIVTAEEISHLDLTGVKLVVLSACQTALGKTYSGEGIYGLQRAFLQAGAETVVISLWEVSDEATRLLMTEFYANLLIKKKPKYEALKQAQLEVKEKYPHPHYWAPFIMVGR